MKSGLVGGEIQMDYELSHGRNSWLWGVDAAVI